MVLSIINKKIKDSNLPDDIRIGAIVRKETVIIPKSNFAFEKGDLVVFLAKREQLKEVDVVPLDFNPSTSYNLSFLSNCE